MQLEVGSKLFKKELNLITNKSLRNHIINILDNYVHFDNYLKPSSSTGKYHPYFDNTDYGNTNHTKAVVKLCKVLLQSRIDLQNSIKDIIYASAILHDMWKYDGRSSHTCRNHAELAFQFLESYSLERNLENDIIGWSLTNIAYIIKYHMGHWSYENKLDWINEISKDEQLKDAILIVHYADIICSRKFYNVEDFSL